MPTTKRQPIRKRSIDHDAVPASHVAATRTISRAYGRAVAGFTLVALLLAGVILTVTGSRATITVSPKVSEREVPFTISVVSATASSGTGHELAGRLLELATTTSETVDVPAAPTSSDPNAKASGVVVISNDSGTPQQLVATTRLLSANGKLFRLVRAATVPAGGSVSAAVQADEPGPSYTLGPTTFTIPGLNPTRQQQVTAASSEPFTLASAAAGLTEAQVAEARSRALAAISKRLSRELEASLFDNETLREEAVTTTPLELRASASVGDSATSITFSGSVRVSATLFNDQELRRMAAAAAGEGAEASGVRYTVQRAPTGSAAIATVAGTVSVRSTELSLAAEDLTGRTEADAAVYLQLLPGVASADVQLRPRWFNRLPQDPSRITIVIR